MVFSQIRCVTVPSCTSCLRTLSALPIFHSDSPTPIFLPSRENMCVVNPSEPLEVKTRAHDAARRNAARGFLCIVHVGVGCLIGVPGPPLFAVKKTRKPVPSTGICGRGVFGENGFSRVGKKKEEIPKSRELRPKKNSKSSNLKEILNFHERGTQLQKSTLQDGRASYQGKR